MKAVPRTDPEHAVSWPMPVGLQSPILRPVPIIPAFSQQDRIPATSGTTSVLPQPVWDCWYDGDFELDCLLEFYRENHQLRGHWSCEALGGLEGGSVNAETWDLGKLTRRRCHGVILCILCKIPIRPHSSRVRIQKQLGPCSKCGADLVHRTCGATANVYVFVNGVHFKHQGSHDHDRPPRLKLSASESKTLRNLILENPTSGPQQLLVGRPTIDGPGESVATISPLLLNSDRISYERRKIIERTDKNSNFDREISKIERTYPGVIQFLQWGNRFKIITLQTTFMSSLLTKPLIDSEAVNGFLSDATHRFWNMDKSLLMITSAFEPTHLKSWVPVLVSFIDGGTAEHYRAHFLQLFLAIKRECERLSLVVTDEHFANVVDFSAAERKGFILAFVDFWIEDENDSRSEDDLIEKAGKLLRGCLRHFEAQITRVKKISAVVHPSRIDLFENFARQMLRSSSASEFMDTTEEFKIAFPDASKWIVSQTIPRSGDTTSSDHL
ncbi:unnamed protein product [Mycena citricolor]|uniref:GCM domain-containing protein n=1 Tax=Mycena citricolor TaxID=2018698 RepID=A0AAD2HV92_9AGAR|nr:unnamed protein product [Mycena citricolor]